MGYSNDANEIKKYLITIVIFVIVIILGLIIFSIVKGDETKLNLSDNDIKEEDKDTNTIQVEENTNIVEENPNIVTDGDTNFINNRLIVEFINELSKEEMESYITSIGAKLIYVISSYEGIIEINTTFNTISEIENYATQFEEEHADMIGYAVPQTVD